MIVNNRDQESTRQDCKTKLVEKGLVVGGRSEIVTMPVPKSYPAQMAHPEQELILGGAHLLESAYELWEAAGLSDKVDVTADTKVLHAMNPNLRATLLSPCFHQRINSQTPPDVLKDIKETYNTMNKGADESIVDRYLEIPHIGIAFKVFCSESKDSSLASSADADALCAIDDAGSGDEKKPDGDKSKKRDQSGKSNLFGAFLKEHFPNWPNPLRFSNARRWFNFVMENQQWEQYRTFLNKKYNFEDERRGFQEQLMETNFKMWEVLKKDKLQDYTGLCCRLAVPNTVNKCIIRCPADADKLKKLSTPLGSTSKLVKKEIVFQGHPRELERAA